VSFAYLVIYRGKPENADAFLRYYTDQHVPLLWKFPRIRAVEVHRGAGEGEIFLVTRLIFDTLDDLHAATASPERELAREDMKNFPPFRGTVDRQAVEVLTMTPPSVP